MADTTLDLHPLPVGSVGRHASGWWGMLCAVATEAALFAYLLFCYYYLTVQAVAPWPPDGLPRLKIALPNTFVLIASSIAVWWGERGIRHGNKARLCIGLALGLVLGSLFVGLQLLEWHNKPFSFTSGPFGSLYFTITGFHLAHVMVGIATLACLAIWGALGYFDQTRHAAVSIGAVYWHFVDVVWLFVFSTFYITPYLGLIYVK